MRAVLLGLVAALALGGPALAKGAAGGGSHYVRGYTTKNGTYVEPHYQTNPNGTRNDNWSTRGNVNPYTGEPGDKPRDEDLWGGAVSAYPYTDAEIRRQTAHDRAAAYLSAGHCREGHDTAVAAHDHDLLQAIIRLCP